MSEADQLQPDKSAIWPATLRAMMTRRRLIAR